MWVQCRFDRVVDSGTARVGVSGIEDFLGAVLASAKDLHSLGTAEVEEDRVPLDDLTGAIIDFDTWQAG